MVIEFNCPECNQTLKTQDERAGKSAKCPNCGTPVTVPSPGAEQDEQDEQDEQADPWGSIDSDEFAEEESAPAEQPFSFSPASTSTPDSVNCAICGEQNPAHATNCRACGESLNIRSIQSPLRQREVHVGFVFSEAWEIYKDNLGISIAAVMVPGLLAIVALLPLIGIPAVIAEEADNAVGAILMLVGMGVFFLIFIYLQLGSKLMLLKIARGLPVGIGDLFKVGKYYIRALLIAFVVASLFSLFSCIIFAIGGGLVAAAIEGGGGNELAFVGVIGGYLFLFLILFVMQVAVWPCPYVLIDRDEPGLGSLSTTFKLFKYHWVASLVIIFVGGLINQVGGMACYVGAIFTMPYVEMMMTVAYCQLMGYKTGERSRHSVRNSPVNR